MNSDLTDLERAILMHIHEDGSPGVMFPVEPDVFEHSLEDLVKVCGGLDQRGLLEMDYPAGSMYAIRNGVKVPIDQPAHCLQCAITPNGIRAISTD